LYILYTTFDIINDDIKYEEIPENYLLSYYFIHLNIFTGGFSK